MIPLNMSRKSMWMNERAFPLEAINTIGFCLCFPEIKIEKLKAAVDFVLTADEIFSLTLLLDGTEFPSLVQGTEKLSISVMKDYVEKSEIKQMFERMSEQKIDPVQRLYSVKIASLREGGSVLFFFFHHILLDGYAMCKVAQQILDVLDGKSLDRILERTEILVQTQKDEEDRCFWLSYFEGLHTQNDIVQGEPTGFKKCNLHIPLTKECTRQIDSYAKEQGLSAASVFAGALSLYQARAAQSEEVVFIMPRLNRPREEDRNELGCKTLVVPVRVAVKDAMSFSKLCREASTKARAASEHKQFGIAAIYDLLKEEGLISDGLSMYTLNFYQNRLHSSNEFAIYMSMAGAMHNHLTINITRFQDCYELSYDGREGVYSMEQLTMFHEAYVKILTDGMRCKAEIGTLPIVAEREEKLLLAMEGKRTIICETDTIPSLFRKAVERFRDRPALYAKDAALTYSELDLISNRIANALLAKGIRQGESILYMLHRDYRVIPVMLGISKAGAAFIPVDPAYPRERILYILKNSGASYLISSSDVKESKGTDYLEVNQLLSFGNAQDPLLNIPQEQLAYCIYTSGTTGNPKGVMLSHRGIVNITSPENNPFNKDICFNGKGIVAIGSICFDISLFEIFVPLFNGMFVEFAPENALVDSEKLAGLIQSHGANILHCTPSRLTAYLRDRSFTEALKGVCAILAAGEVLPGKLVEKLRDIYGIRIYNGYGPTEVTIGATITEAGDSTSIGKPIANTGILLLDAKGRLLPKGATGEICVYGLGVGIGYQGLVEQTNEKFVMHFGRRLYRTGDLGQWLLDGRILYKGRNDSQVKLRGLRIEIAEIENCMLSFTGINAAAVIVKKVAGSEHLVGFYVSEGEISIQGEQLKNHIKKKLPLYMVPDVFKELTILPQTVRGKVDLRALERESVEYIRKYRKPNNKTEKALCDAFRVVLNQEQTGIGDNFFELGGDSLNIAVLLSEIDKRLPGHTLSFGDIFKYPTPELLALQLMGEIEDKEESVLETLDYSGFDHVLTYDKTKQPRRKCLGNILLTGATGFLGIHLLIYLLEHQELWENIYCIVRANKRLTARKRLIGSLFYYGENEYAELLDHRLFVVEGDICTEKLFVESFSAKIDTVLHSAADVSHFSHDDKLDKINVGGTRHLLNFCKEQSAAFVQVSTISVGGVYKKTESVLKLTEEQLYLGQEIQNQYIMSKFMSEYEVLKAALEHGIPVKIMRVGNLQGRIMDGEFQMNVRTNAFTRQIASYANMKKAPRTLYQSTVNFSPVDEVARMIVELAALQDAPALYHVYPPQEVPFAALFSSLAGIGHEIVCVDDDEFEAYISELSKTKEGKSLVEGILLERRNLTYADTEVSQDITNDILNKIGISWSPITEDYLQKYFSALDALQIFE